MQFMEEEGPVFQGLQRKQELRPRRRTRKRSGLRLRINSINTMYEIRKANDYMKTKRELKGK